MSVVWNVVLDFFVRFLSPITPFGMPAWVLHSVLAWFITLLAIYVAATVIVQWQRFERRDSYWMAQSLISRCYVHAAILVGFLWSLTIAYCIFTRTTDGWPALVPYWEGVLVTTLVGLFFLSPLRKRVRASSLTLPTRG